MSYGVFRRYPYPRPPLQRGLEALTVSPAVTVLLETGVFSVSGGGLTIDLVADLGVGAFAASGQDLAVAHTIELGAGAIAVAGQDIEIAEFAAPVVPSEPGITSGTGAGGGAASPPNQAIPRARRPKRETRMYTIRIGEWPDEAPFEDRADQEENIFDDHSVDYYIDHEYSDPTEDEILELIFSLAA